jgi:hypothetical protein
LEPDAGGGFLRVPQGSLGVGSIGRIDEHGNTNALTLCRSNMPPRAPGLEISCDVGLGLRMCTKLPRVDGKRAANTGDRGQVRRGSEVPVAVYPSRLSSREAGKALIFPSVRESFEECRLCDAQSKEVSRIERRDSRAA